MSDYKELTPIIAHAIIDGLRGSCHTLEQECADWEVDPDEFMEKYSQDMDEVIFNCERCGWWTEVGDYGHSNEGITICSNCEEDEDEEE